MGTKFEIDLKYNFYLGGGRTWKIGLKKMTSLKTNVMNVA